MFKRALLVEDSPVSQKAISKLLQTLGFEFDIAPDGQEAVKASRLHDYAVILMDLRMPYMDGFAAAKVIRADGNDVPIVALTAYILQEDIDRCVGAGMDHLLCKPITLAHLADVLNFWANTQVSVRTLKEQAADMDIPCINVDQLGEYDTTVTQLTHLRNDP